MEIVNGTYYSRVVILVFKNYSTDQAWLHGGWEQELFAGSIAFLNTQEFCLQGKSQWIFKFYFVRACVVWNSSVHVVSLSQLPKTRNRREEMGE